MVSQSASDAVIPATEKARFSDPSLAFLVTTLAIKTCKVGQWLYRLDGSSTDAATKSFFPDSGGSRQSTGTAKNAIVEPPRRISSRHRYVRRRCTVWCFSAIPLSWPTSIATRGFAEGCTIRLYHLFHRVSHPVFPGYPIPTSNVGLAKSPLCQLHRPQASPNQSTRVDGPG